MKNLQKQIKSALSETHNAFMKSDNFDLFMPDADKPLHDKGTVQLIDKMKFIFKSFQLQVKESDLFSVYYKHSGCVNANQSRLADYISLSLNQGVQHD